MAILFSFLFISYLLDLHIPVDDATKLISSVLNSKFITSAITSWPLAVVIVAFAFKKGILNLLKEREITVSGGGGNGLLVSIGDRLETVAENLKEAPKKDIKDIQAVIDIPVQTMINDQLMLDAVFQKALIDPTQTIIDIWSDFLIGLENIMNFVKVKTDLEFEGDISHVMDVLYGNGKVSKQAADAIKDLFIISKSVESNSLKVRKVSKDKRVQFAIEASDYYKFCAESLEQLRTELSKTLAEDLHS
ncbi:hypothetical protein [Bacillus subtilis]|uniref:hypothetical protein n=1 Tax=Bacillus subtilis TaxID=1423 RepID=UPI00165BB33E|nr:hypothetical protein [Bacillus subtilis]MEC1423550.1 hypothetical protein [Bacillus subtilis]MEC1442541.1 hypothetical protein [Bacillus subtilis]MED2969170.1 hypothetical protein [Bacillus subtilis]